MKSKLNNKSNKRNKIRFYGVDGNTIDFADKVLMPKPIKKERGYGIDTNQK